MNGLNPKQKSLLDTSFNKLKSKFKASPSFTLADQKEYLAKAVRPYKYGYTLV